MIKRQIHVLFLTDNEALVAIINKQTSKSERIMKLLGQLVLSCMYHNILFKARYILFKARHIAGKKNIVADKSSRFDFQEAKKINPILEEKPTHVQKHLAAKY